MEQIRPVLRWRTLLLALAGAAALAGGLLVALSNGTKPAVASAPDPASVFSSLNSTAPTGLRIVTHSSTTVMSVAQAIATAQAQGPGLPATSPVPGNPWPIISTIRKLVADPTTGVDAWIAQSDQGGVCILETDPTAGIYGMGVSCNQVSDPTKALVGEIGDGSKAPGKMFLLGVVPTGVSSVQTSLVDGTTKALPVNNNAFVQETNSSDEVSSVNYAEAGQAHSLTLGGTN